MHSDKKRRGRAAWTSADETDPRVVDLESVSTRAGRAPERGRPEPARGGRSESSRARRVDDDPNQRVGGRRRVRPEIILPLLGAVFVIGALLKPWSGAVPVHSPSPNALPPIARATASLPAATEAPTPGPLYGFPVSPVRGLVTVDWRNLSVADRHSGWGVAAATLSRAGLGSGAGSPAPSIIWQEAVVDSSMATVTIDPSREVYGVAITWPEGFDSQNVVFTYKGPGPTSSVYYENPMVRQGATQVNPLPAAAVSTDTPDSTQGPLTIHSGQFWVAPLVGPPEPGRGSAADAWKSGPWAWPSGDYEVLIAVPAGYEMLNLRIGPYG